LLLVMLSDADIAKLMADAVNQETSRVRIDLKALRVTSYSVDVCFSLSERHYRMQLERQDLIGLSLTYQEQIQSFAQHYWEDYPWLHDVASRTRSRLPNGRQSQAIHVEKGAA